MSKNIKYLSELDKYELININDGERYDYLQNNDVVVDSDGNLKFLIVNISSNKLSFFGGTREFLEIPWECVRRIGIKTIILDAEEEKIKRTKI